MTKLDQLKAALAATTPGEWKVRDKIGLGGCKSKIDCEQGYVVIEGYCSPSANIKYKDLWAEAEGNAAFAALAHNLMPDLLEALDLIESMARDTGLVQLMRPDQVRRVMDLQEKLK